MCCLPTLIIPSIYYMSESAWEKCNADHDQHVSEHNAVQLTEYAAV